MAPKNTDTDPSTPTARRPPLSRAPGAIAAAASAETEPEAPASPGASPSKHADHTDPGVGPPAPLRSLPPQAVGLVVPGPAVAATLGDPIAESAATPPMPLGTSSPPPSLGSASRARSTPPTAPQSGPPAAAGAPPPAPVGSDPPATSAPGTASQPPTGSSPAPLPPRQDSVELLLDGISGPRPGRARTTPQTGGQAAAVYHAEHDLHAGRPTAEESKNVLVERPVTPRAIPIAAAARRAAQIGTARVDSTVVTGRALARRLVLALVGAVVVVVALFTAFRSTKVHPVEGHFSVASAPSAGTAPEPSSAVAAEPSAAAASAPSATAPESEAPPSTESAEPATAGAASAAAAGGTAAVAHPAARPLVAPSLVHKRRKVGGLAGGASGAGDVGEFKTTF